MPLNQFRRYTGMCGQTVNDTRYASRNNSTREVNAISHRIAGTHFDRNLVFIHQFHQFHTKRNHKSVNIRSCDIFQMTTWADTCLQTFTDDTQIMIHGLTSGHFHFIENMVIGTADQDTCLTQSDVFY